MKTRYLWPDPSYKVVKLALIDQFGIGKRKPWMLYHGWSFVGYFKTKREANAAIPKVEA